MRGLFEGWHLVILLIVVIVLFGAKRLPDAARGVGRSLRILKAEVRDMKDEEPQRPATRAPEAVEGRIVHPVEPEAGQPAPTDQRRDV